MAENYFWQRSMDSWTWQTLQGFLEEEQPEGLHLEYKQPTHKPQSGKWEITSKLVETVVGMANTVDGLLIIGVSDVADRGPRAIVGINHAVPENALRNHCANAVEPTVGLEIRVITIPESEPDGGKFVMIVRIRRGLNPPYLLRDRGVLMRMADQDRHATVRDLQELFERRRETTPAGTGEGSRVHDLIFGLLSMIDRDLPPLIGVSLAPVFPRTPVELGLEADLAFSDILRRAFSLRVESFLEPDGLSYIPEHDATGSDRLTAAIGLADGSIGLRQALPYDTTETGYREIAIEDVWHHARKLLSVTREWSRTVCSVAGPLQYTLGIGNIADTVLTINPRLVESIAKPLAVNVPQRRNQLPHWIIRDEWDDEDIDSLIEHDLASFARQMQCRAFAACSGNLLRDVIKQRL